MKAPSRIFSLIACALFFSPVAKSQCISTFPYVQDFEKFTSISSTSSCTTTQLGDTADGWTQDQTDQGEWRADSLGTPSYLTGPGSSFTTTGMGFGTDYNPGRKDGIYLYTESSTNTCGGGSINLLSPCFDLSGTSTYRIKLGYNMHGGGMGSLHIDVLDSNIWVNDVWYITGHQGSGWKEASVILAPFNKSSTQIRIRAKIGPVWSSDIAIDGFTIEKYTPKPNNISIVEILDTARDYYNTTPLHTDDIDYTVRIANNGSNKATSIQIKAESGSWSHTQSVGSLDPYTDTLFSLSRSFKPTKTNQDEISFRLTMSSADDDTTDNNLKMATGISDSVLGRDNGLAAGAIGVNGSGQMGQMLYVESNDTLTGVRFFLVNPVIGDSVRVNLYEFSGGRPQQLVATSKHVVISGGGWHQAVFSCDQPLTTGAYLVAVDQVLVNNMSLGSTIDAFEPNTTMFWNGVQWENLTSGANAYPYALMIRMVFGKRHRPVPTISSLDSICQKQRLTITAGGGDKYEWGPAANIKFPQNRSTIAESDTNFTLSLKAWDACGIPSYTVTKDIKVNETPKGWVSSDTTICKGDQANLRASGGTNYSWAGGPKNSSWNVSPSSSETFQVIFDSTNGCRLTLSTTVGVQNLQIKAEGDTTVCSGETVTISASGAATYTWTPGGTGATQNVSPPVSTDYFVTGTSTIGCKDIDTVTVTVNKAPDLKVPHDTIVCFGRRFDLEASGADSFQWRDGPSTAKYNVLPILSKWLYVEGINNNGCRKTDSLYMVVASVPQVELRDDTTICEGTSVDLEAITTDKVEYIWSTGDTSRKISVSPMQETTYKLLVKNNGNCSDSAEVTVSLDPLPVIDFTYKVDRDKITFTNNSLHGTDHAWTFGDGESSDDVGPFHRFKDTGTYTMKYVITNECGSKDTTFDVPVYWVGVEKINLAFGFDLYPQPGSKSVYLKVHDPEIHELNVLVYDMSGKLVLRYDGLELSNRIVELDIHQLKAGSYLIHAQNEKGIGRKMLLKH